MTGTEYANLVAGYLVTHFGDRGISVYREVNLGKTIIGKNRRIDIFAVHADSNRPLAIECKYQDSQGTADEKIPYALNDMASLNIPGYIAYAGEGFSKGIQHMLAASPIAAYCLPRAPGFEKDVATRELDHAVAMAFGWWDLVIANKKPFVLT